MESEDSQIDWDVIIVGGGLAGSSTAYRLLMEKPSLRVLIVDRGDGVKKIGESTVEVSSYFLGRTLNLSDYLSRNHVTKQGLRFWFTHTDCEELGDCSEIGPGYHVNLPAYQVDREKLDAEVLDRAENLGAKVLSPARVRSIKLEEGGVQQVEVRMGTDETVLTCRWLVDASGPARFLARQEGWVVPNERHQTSSIWARYTGVKNWDDAELRERFPEYSQRCHGSRNTATNHVMGDGWWAWWILLESGEVSIGVVYDERLVQFDPNDRDMKGRLRSLLVQSPVAREMLADATLVPDSVVYRGQLAYSSKQICGDGYVLVGDAAGFLDPFYSPGLDWVAFTTSLALDLIAKECPKERPLAKRVKAHNTNFKRSYKRWFEALYENKYLYQGDFQLMRMAFLADLAGYYYGVVRGIYKKGSCELIKPVFGELAATPPFLIIRLYNRRLAKIARNRRKRGVFGKTNKHHFETIRSYTLDWRLPVRLFFNLRVWLWLELKEGWRTWFRPGAEIAPAKLLKPKPVDKTRWVG